MTKKRKPFGLVAVGIRKLRKARGSSFRYWRDAAEPIIELHTELPEALQRALAFKAQGRTVFIASHPTPPIQKRFQKILSARLEKLEKKLGRERK